MDMKDSRLNFALRWKVAVLIVGLCIGDFVLAWYLRVRFSDLLFMEGILVFMAGVLIAGGGANLRRESPSTMMGSPSGHTEFLEEQRRKQISDGITLAIIGGILIGISIVIYLL